MPRIHMTRKNAIIAVTKSAYATFQEPPWCPPPWLFFFFLMMMTRPEPFGTLRRLLPRQRFELRERRSLRGLDVPARKLHAGHRCIATRKGQQRGANTAHVIVLCLD